MSVLSESDSGKGLSRLTKQAGIGCTSHWSPTSSAISTIRGQSRHTASLLQSLHVVGREDGWFAVLTYHNVEVQVALA